jgi:Flp pilus assembly protein TadG
LLRRRGNAVRGFATASSGMAATEFALISPIMIAMFFGVTEFSNVYEANTKMTAVTSTLADLLAQEKIACNAEVLAAFGAATTIMYPFPASAIKLRVSSLIDNGNSTVKVAWSEQSNWTTLPLNQAPPEPVPEGLVGTGGSVIMAEVQYTYSLPVHRFFAPSVTFSDKYYLHPRKVDQITRETTCT